MDQAQRQQLLDAAVTEYERAERISMRLDDQMTAVLGIVLPMFERFLRDDIAETIAPVYQKAIESVAAYGSTWAVDLVGECLNLVWDYS